MSEINIALLNDFIDESREHLDEMESLLLQLGSDLSNLDLLNDIFRTMHNVKGASQLTGLKKISSLSHRLEDLLDLLRRGERQTTSVMVNLLISGRDRIVKLVSELENSQQEITDVDDLIGQLTILIDTGSVKDKEGQADQFSAQQREEAIAERDTSYDEKVTHASSEDKVYDDEDDVELFSIFLEHLKEQFSLLASASSHFKQVPVEDEYLKECSESVNRLRSSANYMGYSDLVKLFINWGDSLDESRQDMQAGDDVILDFMDSYLDELVTRYPELEAYRTTPYTQRESSQQSSAHEQEIKSEEALPYANREAEADSSSHSPVVNTSLLPEFIEESREHLDEMESLLLQLADELEDVSLLHDIFRTMHNVKGAAQLTGLDRISRLSHRLEDLLDMLRQQQLHTSAGIVNILISGRDRIVQLISELENSQQEVSDVEELIGRINQLISGGNADDGSNDEVTTDITTAKDTSSQNWQGDVPAIEISTVFDEENDKELYAIFIEHLKEQFSVLTTASAHFKQVPIDEEHLEECRESILRIRSSSNYMGYEKLVAFFDAWIGIIENAMRQVSLAGTVSPDFMDGFVSELTVKFPTLSDVSVSIIDRGRQNHVEPPPTKQRQAPAEEKAGASETHQVRGTVSQIEDNQLFNRLNSALESSLQKVSASEYETLNNVFDELMSTSSSKEDKSKAVVKTETQKPAKQSASGSRRHKMELSQAKEKENKDKKIKKTLRVDADKIDALMNQVGELVVDRSYFYQLFNEMRDLQQYLKEVTGIDQKELKMFRAFSYRLSEAISSLGRTSNELQEGVMKMRMLPISHLFNRYPRLVHDLTLNSDKKVNLILRGEETELDKMIVEELSDPLIHIIRNAIDHGIEPVEDRLKSGKNESGKLILEAYQESNHIVIEVTDDGRGLNPIRIKEKAVSKGIYSVDEIERLSNREVMNIILMPGFSTAEKITGTSGRGVGMDVVKKNIEKLNGTLDIDSRPGKGTRMRLKIPLTLAIIHALMVRVGKDMFTIPLANVDETVRISKEDTSIVEGVEVIHLRGVALPIFRLSALFKVPADANLSKSFVVIVNTDGQRVGFVVDELLGQEEVVIKPLEDYVQERSGFSGATIVGDGRISLILDVYELVKMTTSRQVKRHKQQAAMLKAARPKLQAPSSDINDRLH